MRPGSFKDLLKLLLRWWGKRLTIKRCEVCGTAYWVLRDDVPPVCREECVDEYLEMNRED